MQLDFRPRKKAVVEILEEMKGKPLLKGGGASRWKDIERLTYEWLDLAKLRNYTIERLDQDGDLVFMYQESDKTKPWKFRDHIKGYRDYDMEVDAFHVIKDAIRERQQEKRHMATIEYEILLHGGMLIGIGKGVAYVWFTSIGDRVMSKLLEDKTRHTFTVKRSF